MARTVAPLLSFEASGAIAKTQVYSKWKGRPYARRYTIPSNPKTAEQSLTRNTFSWLNSVYRLLASDVTLGWDAYATVQRYTSRNGWIARNLGGLREEVDLANLIFSPAVLGGTVAATMDLVAGSTQIEVTLTPPPLPTGWSVSAAYAAAIRDQDPQTEILYTVTAGTDAATPFVITLTGLTASELYRVGGWFKYLRPDGQFAFGEALMDSATPTA